MNKTLRLNSLKATTAINAKISVFAISVEAIIYLLQYNLHDCTSNICPVEKSKQIKIVSTYKVLTINFQHH